MAVLASVVGLIVLLLLWFQLDRGERGEAARPSAASESGSSLAGPQDSTAVPVRQAGAESVGFRVLDLATGLPVPGVCLQVPVGADTVDVLSDERGVVTTPAPGVTGVPTVADSRRWAVPPRINETPGTGILWIHGWIAVEGVVRARGKQGLFTPERVRLHVVQGAPNAHLGQIENGKLRAYVRRVPVPEPTLPDGRFEMRVPRLHEITVAATCKGWKPATHTIDVSRSPGREFVDLRLERAMRVRGVLLSSDGTPLGRIPVYCFALMRLPAADASPERLRLLAPNGGFGAGVSSKRKVASVKFNTQARTDAEGQFEIVVPNTGELVLVAYPFGHRPAYLDLGVGGAEDIDGVSVVAEKIAQPSRVLVVDNGKRVEESKLLISDLSLKEGDAQPGTYLLLDEDGRVPADWLVSGTCYYFQIADYYGHMVWDGRETLDVARDLESVSTLPDR